MSETTPALPPTPATATIKRSPGISPAITVLIAIFLAFVIGFSVFSHRANANEKLVARVVAAVQRNDMAPVAKDFNAVTREQLTRGSVGRLSDQVAPLGRLKRVDETTPKDAAPRHYTFTVHFEKGDWTALMALDEDGKITSFHLRPPA